MKSFFISTFLVLTSVVGMNAYAPNAYAQDEQEAPPVPPVKDGMKEMANGLRLAGQALSQSNLDAAKMPAAALRKGIAMVLSAEPVMSTVPGLTPEQIEARIHKYYRALTAVHQDALDLEQALIQRNETLAKNLLKKISDARSPNHTEFKPPTRDEGRGQ